MKKKVIIFLSLIMLSLFLANRLLFFRPTILEKSVSCLTYPIIRLSAFVTNPFKRLYRKYHSHKKLLSRLKKLEQEREHLLQENISLAATFQYDKKSKELREFQDRYKLEQAILSKVLVKTLTDEEQTIIVNRGSRNGVRKNMVAIYKFQLLGRVTEVLPWYCKITLITDSRSKVSAYTNASSAPGVVEGINNIHSCHLRYVSHLANIEKHDFVLSSGQGLVFPEGFCLGKIVHFKTNDVCHEIEIEPLVDFSTLEMCYLTNQAKMNLF